MYLFERFAHAWQLMGATAATRLTLTKVRHRAGHLIIPKTPASKCANCMYTPLYTEAYIHALQFLPQGWHERPQPERCCTNSKPREKRRTFIVIPNFFNFPRSDQQWSSLKRQSPAQVNTTLTTTTKTPQSVHQKTNPSTENNFQKPRQARAALGA